MNNWMKYFAVYLWDSYIS